jgi:hypothetical protein
MQVIKALAGYIELPNGRSVVFAEFLELENGAGNISVEQADQVMGEIAAAVFESLVPRSSN